MPVGHRLRPQVVYSIGREEWMREAEGLMRTVVYGVGAIGGTVAASLALSGQEVVGIARGAQLAAIRASGLLLRTPDRRGEGAGSPACRIRPRSTGGRTMRSS